MPRKTWENSNVPYCSVQRVWLPFWPPASTTAQAQDKLIISTANPPQHMATRTMQMFADALVDRSGGALEVEIFDSSQLYNARDVGKAVARGDVGFANVPTPYLGRTVGSINVLDLPMLKGMTQMERSEMLDGPLGEQLGSMLEEKMGVEVPGNGPRWTIMYWSTKKPSPALKSSRA